MISTPYRKYFFWQNPKFEWWQWWSYKCSSIRRCQQGPFVGALFLLSRARWGVSKWLFSEVRILVRCFILAGLRSRSDMISLTTDMMPSMRPWVNPRPCEHFTALLVRFYNRSGSGEGKADLLLLGPNRGQVMNIADTQKAQKIIVITNIIFQARINLRSRVISWWKKSRKQILTAYIDVQVNAALQVSITWIFSTWR